MFDGELTRWPVFEHVCANARCQTPLRADAAH
ncbi:hypothetical protein XOCgx_2728 [Xanthomonas oryzae pv. oryzicola]|nr:hypothetical protein XOCgx_2728 [Xanthomonas oryzae pv. oryzicola]